MPRGQVRGRVWDIAIDEMLWPVNPGDLVVDVDTAQEWLVVSADLRQNNIDPAVNYVEVKAHAHTIAAGTRP